MKRSIGPKPLAFCAPVWVIGSYSRSGKPAMMTASWGGTCCSKPPCVGISLRKATSAHGNISARQAFTVNIPSEKYLAETDFCGMASSKDTDKFEICTLTPVRSDLVDAPYVAEFPLVLECKVIHTVEIGLHTQFIGEILDIKADSSALGREDLPDIERVRPLVYDSSHSRYFAVGQALGGAFQSGKVLAGNAA